MTNRTVIRRFLCFAAVVFALVLTASCSTVESWEDGPTKNNAAVMDTFFSDWLDYAESHPPSGFLFPSDEAWDALVSWRDNTYSGQDVSHAQIELAPRIALGITAISGRISRVEVSCVQQSEEEPLSEEERESFILACECTAYAFGAEKTVAGPESLVSNLLTDLEADSRIQEEGKTPSASAKFARRSYRLETNEEQTSLAFIGVS